MTQETMLSVIIPVYNVEEYLAKCVDSILNQTYKNLEVILVNDGSKDGSGSICDAFAQKDPRVRVIHKENGGLSSARNAGIEAAKGEYITFVDSDDWIEADAYAHLMELMQRYQVKLVCDIFDEMGTTMYVEERLIPAGTALASCGIAFAMRYIRAASEGGVEIGFRPEEARKIVEYTVKGAAELLLASGNNPEVEIDKVTTAGGITIKGLNEMEHEGFTSAVIKGLKACL